MSGPATEKARLPNCVLLCLTAAARVVEERSWRKFESAEANTMRSDRYDGHRWWKVMHDSSNFEGDTVLDRQPV